MNIHQLCAECGKQGNFNAVSCTGCKEVAPVCADCIEELGGTFTCEVCQEALEQEKEDELA